MRNPGLEPGSPKRALEPESSASANSASPANSQGKDNLQIYNQITYNQIFYKKFGNKH